MYNLVTWLKNKRHSCEGRNLFRLILRLFIVQNYKCTLALIKSIQAWIPSSDGMTKNRFLGLILLLIPNILQAQSINIDLADEVDGETTGRIIQMVALITVLSLAPAILMMTTSFTRFVVVFSLLRSAIGLQQSPPNMVVIGLALFMTFFVMSPTFEEAYETGLKPMIEEEITEEEAFKKIALPFHKFMRAHVREKDVELFMNVGNLDKVDVAEQIPYRALIPAFIISELKRAFEIGFLIFVPFIVIDMVVASILMSMGMMMLPPVMVSLPFKIIFFVMVDGWYMLAGSLIESFG